MDIKIDKQRSYFTLKSVNPVIRVLTISDLVMVSSYGLFAPIFAVFITGQIEGGNLAVAGTASAIFLLAKSIFTIPTALLIDWIKGEKDDFWAIFSGSVVFSLMPLFYLLVHTPLELYIVEFFYGLSAAVIVPAWNAIWVRHIDRGHEGMESGIYNTLTGLGGALTASLGGFIASNYGFSPLFIAVTVSSLFGTGFLVLIYKKMIPGKIIQHHGKRH